VGTAFGAGEEAKVKEEEVGKGGMEKRQGGGEKMG